MRAVLISIAPEWCEKILNGEKIIEVRKTAPKPPFKVYIYCTKGRDSLVYSKDREWNGKVVAEFVCNNVEDFSEWEYDYPSLLRHIDLYAGTKGDYRFLDNYLKGNKKGYALHISDLKIYDTPKELSEFNKKCKHFDKMENVDGNYVYAVGNYEAGNYEDSRCYACKYFGFSLYDGVRINFFPYCVKNGKIPITRPPQSWQYMEEMK